MDTYDEQIEALLDHDYLRFCELIGFERSCLIEDHNYAWGYTGDQPESLFAYLPGACCCASQIERLENAKKYPDLAALLLDDAPLHLSPYGPTTSQGFTRQELEEFARRQRLARS